jgi:hypothetical protein
VFDDRSIRRTRAHQAVAFVGVLALGIAGGRLSVPEGQHPTAPGPGGVQVGFPDSASGVRAAALEFTTARLRTPLLPVGTRRAMLARIGTDAFASRVIREDDANDLSGLGQNAAEVRYLTTGLGTRLESLRGGHARVVVWAMRALSGVVLPVASFTTQVVDLRRSGTDWQVISMRDARRQAIPRVLQAGGKTATNAVLDGMTPASYGTP